MKFPEREDNLLSAVDFPTMLTEFQAFTSCLWLKARPPRVPRPMMLLRYWVKGGNFSLNLKPADDGDRYKIILTMWPRYGIKKTLC